LFFCAYRAGVTAYPLSCVWEFPKITIKNPFFSV
jgi:hypothetical protein